MTSPPGPLCEIELRAIKVEIAVDPMTIAGISAYQRQIQRVIGHLTLKTKEIIIPHPRAHKRRFVMEPLAELDKNWGHPVLKINVIKILKTLNNQNIEIFDVKEILI